MSIVIFELGWMRGSMQIVTRILQHLANFMYMFSFLSMFSSIM